MKILFQIPSLESVYAAKFIYLGYRDAFTRLGHDVRPLTSADNCETVLKEFDPDIFVTSLNSYSFKFLDLEVLKSHRAKGMVMFTQIRAWLKQNDQYGGSDLQHEEPLVRLIKDNLAGDVFYHWLEQEDPLMEGFTKETGYPWHTILLAANTDMYFSDYSEVYKADICYVGSLLPTKIAFIDTHVKPLFKNYNVKVYGSDWTTSNRLLGYVQKAGQYFNIDMLKKVRKLSLALEDERKVYTSSTISLNIHEDHQRRYGSDFNERTLKIIASKGFEICDNVRVLRKYFKEDELVIAQDKKDWFDKIDYYIKNPEKREAIMENGYKVVCRDHTYDKRVEQILSIYSKFKGTKHAMSNM